MKAETAVGAEGIERKLKQRAVVGFKPDCGAVGEHFPVNIEKSRVRKASFRLLFLFPRVGKIEIYSVELAGSEKLV